MRTMLLTTIAAACIATAPSASATACGATQNMSQQVAAEAHFLAAIDWYISCERAVIEDAAAQHDELAYYTDGALPALAKLDEALAHEGVCLTDEQAATLKELAASCYARQFDVELQHLD